MDTRRPLPLLGGLSAAAFMRRHWQKAPLLVRAALPGVAPPLTRQALFALAARDDVESRLVARRQGRWTMRRGPLPRRALPAVQAPDWTLLVQGLDLHVSAARSLLEHFRFVPDARLDDLMVSWASDGGGVGPHVDSYDVFLIQVQGRRRWRIGRVADPAFCPDLPVKILQHFEPEQEWVLEPGDLLYLPPGWGHDGVAQGECMTCSVGFRAPAAGELAAEVLQRLAEEAVERMDQVAAARALYADPSQPATARPGQVPARLQRFAARALAQVLAQPGAVDRALGEVLTEPKPLVWFEAGGSWQPGQGVALDARTRMLVDARHVHVNGQSWRAGGRDAQLLAALADHRVLSAAEVARLGPDALAVLQEWVQAGWAHAVDGPAVREERGRGGR